MKSVLEILVLFALLFVGEKVVFGQTYSSLPFSDNFGSSNPTASLGSSWSTSSTLSNGFVESRSDVTSYAQWHRVQFPSDNALYQGTGYLSSYGAPAANGLLFYNSANQTAPNYISADLRLNLAGASNVQAAFNISDWGTSGSPGTDYRDELIISISTNGGTSFGTTTTTVDLGADPHADGTWNSVTINLSDVASANLLTLSSTTVVRFTAKLRRRAVLNSMRSDANRQYIIMDNLAVTGTVTLPVELTQFNAEKDNTNTLLTWQTASEINNHYFEVERSSNGVNFESIAKVNGQGNSNVMSAYLYVDEKPFEGENYYRLKQVDFDGTTTYSVIKLVSFDSPILSNIYPNPSNGNVFVNTQGKGIIAVYDATGKLVHIQNFTESINSNELSLENLVEGNYFIRVINGASPLNSNAQMITLQ